MAAACFPSILYPARASNFAISRGSRHRVPSRFRGCPIPLNEIILRHQTFAELGQRPLGGKALAHTHLPARRHPPSVESSLTPYQWLPLLAPSTSEFPTPNQPGPRVRSTYGQAGGFGEPNNALSNPSHSSLPFTVRPPYLIYTSLTVGSELVQDLRVSQSRDL